jgi:hypothetical protein
MTDHRILRKSESLCDDICHEYMAATERANFDDYPRWPNGQLKVLEKGMFQLLSEGDIAEYLSPNKGKPAIDITQDSVLSSIRQQVRTLEARRGRGNRLKSWMVEEYVIETKKRLRGLQALGPHIKPIDTRVFYEKYCENKRRRPSLKVLNSTQAIGLEIFWEPSTFGSGFAFPSYFAFFIPGYGSWLPSVREMDGIVEFIEMIYQRDIPIVVYEKKTADTLIGTVHACKQSTGIPTIEVLQGDEDLDSVIWKRFGVDVITWKLMASLVRLLSGPEPKNPIECSFMVDWSLTWEQMVYMSMRPMLALLLAFLPTNTGKGHSQ